MASFLKSSLVIISPLRFLPIANVAKIMKASIPENAKIAKDAKECVQVGHAQFAFGHGHTQYVAVWGSWSVHHIFELRGFFGGHNCQPSATGMPFIRY